jgi:hypothetical protein
MGQLKSIISEHYSELASSYITGILHGEKLHLAQQVKFKLPYEVLEGRDDVIRMISYTVPVFIRFEIHRQYFDEDSCCSILTHYTRVPCVPIPNTQFIQVKEGQIIEISLLHDTTAWNRFLMLQQH